MRQPWSQLADDVDVDVVLVDVILVEDEVADEFLALLHELALEAIALRATSPGDPRPEVEPVHGPAAADARATTWLLRRLGRRGVAKLAVIAAAALAVAVAPGVVDTRRAAARLAVLEATPSVLEPMTSPPVELWRVPGRVVSDQADVLVVAGPLVGSPQRTDPATGESTGTVASTPELWPGSPGVVDLATGEGLDIEGARRTPVAQEYSLPGGARATWSWHPDGNSGQGSVTRKDGAWVFGLWGPPLVPAITDESEAGTLVVMTAAGDRLLGRDLRTGRSRWSVPYDGAVPVRAAALVDGVMLLDDGATVTAIDVRTGDGLWRAQIASDVTQGSALVDGEVVLLPVRDGGTAVELAAVRIADGALLWRTGTPAGTVSLTVVDHRLIASTGDAVVGLG